MISHDTRIRFTMHASRRCAVTCAQTRRHSAVQMLLRDTIACAIPMSSSQASSADGVVRVDEVTNGTATAAALVDVVQEHAKRQQNDIMAKAQLRDDVSMHGGDRRQESGIF